MQLTLPESSHRRSRTAGGTLLSTVLHAAAISAAVAGTAISAPRPVTRDTLEKIVFVQPERKESTPPPPDSPPQHPPERRVGTIPLVPPLTPPAPDIAIDPTVIPTTIPDLGTPLGAIPEGRTETATASTFGGSGSASGTSLDGAPMSALAVDDEVVVVQGAAPRYPPTLASAGIEGMVMARYVVDTLGRVERGSIEVTSNSNAMFAQSVRDAVGRMRFIPAKAQGRKVRQLVQQPFTFELTRR